MRTPRTTPSRSGPRKPGHSAGPISRARARRGWPARRRGRGRFVFRRSGSGRSLSLRGSGGAAGTLGWSRRRRKRLGLATGLSQEPLLGSRRPPPMELRAAPADTGCPQQCPRRAREHDCSDHGQAPDSIAEMTGRHRPCDQGKAQERDRRDVEQHPHPGHRDRLVDHKPGRRHRGDDQDDGPKALDPRRPAEQQPPDDDGESANDPPEDREQPIGSETTSASGAIRGTPNASSH